MSWGFHAVLNIAGCAPASIRCPKNIKRFSKELVSRIDMVAYGEAQVVLFGTGNKKGYTLVQLIETSCISAHFCEEDNAAFIDVFSCKPFIKEDVEKVVNEFFEPTVTHSTYFQRAIPKLK